MNNPAKRSEGSTRVLPLRRYVPFALVLFFGALVSVVLLVMLRNWELDRIQVEFQRLGGDRGVTLQRSIDRNLELLHSIGGLFAASHKVERQEFSEFVERTLDLHNDIQVLSWVPRIKNSERAAFEKTTRAMGFSGFEITERKTQGQMVGAERREEYFPVYYLNPMEGNETAFGYDLASNPTRLASLEKSRDTGRLLATGRITLVQEAGRQYGFLLVKPIYRNGAPTETIEERRENLVGYATGAFRIGDMVEASLKVLSRRGIDVYLYDETAPGDKQLLHVYGPKAIGAEAHSTREHEEAANIRKGPYWRTMLSIPGRKWSLLFISAPDFLAAHRQWRSWGILTVGFLLTALLGTYMFRSLRRTAMIEDLVAERTSELNKTVEELEIEFAVRQQAEAALGETHKKLQGTKQYLESLIESSTDAIIATDKEKNVVLFNEGAEALFGYRRDEVLGRRGPILYESKDDAKEVMRRMREGGGTVSAFETTLRAKDGTIIPVLISASLLYDEEGREAGTVGFSKDIRVRKKAEAELLQYREHLEELVEERTAELHAVNKELEAFSYSVAHDLRQPLRGISGFSGALLEDYSDKLDAQGKDYLKRVDAASQRMARMIDSLLDMSRVMRVEIHRGPVDLSGMAKSIASSLQEVEPEREVEFVISDGLIAEGDARLLRLVLENLLGNAWKFTSKRARATIEFGVSRDDGHGEYYVRDDGVGFDNAYADQLFIVFQRLHRVEEFSGSGVGLSITQRIVERHGGRIWAEGEVDKGATFYFTL